MAVAPVVRKLRVRNFRSFVEAEVSLDNPTILVGRNGAGKSNLVDAFAFLSESAAAPLETVLERRGGIRNVRRRGPDGGPPPRIDLAILFGRLDESTSSAGYRFVLKPAKNYGFRVVHESCHVLVGGVKQWFFRNEKKHATSVEKLAPTLSPTALALPLIGGDERFAPLVRALADMRVYTVQTSRLRELHDPDDGRALRADGGNASSVLRDLERRAPEDVARIVELLAAVAPGTVGVRSVRLGPKLSMEFQQDWGRGRPMKFDAAGMSDGTLRALAILLAVYQRPKPSLLVLEEPEASIHPGAGSAMMDILQIASGVAQVVATTHSPDLLDAKWIAGRNLRIVEWVDGASRVSDVSDGAARMLKDHLQTAGEMLRANALRAKAKASEPPREDVAEGPRT